MHWTHAAHPERRVRLAYCLNLHAARDLDGALEGMRTVTLPLRDRLAAGKPFGVGVYLSGEVVSDLATEDGTRDGPGLSRLAGFLEAEGLDPFTFNAFPYSGFHEEGLKEDVYRPTWLEEERVRYTLQVAHTAAHLARAKGTEASEHISISTHPGLFADWVTGPADLEACAANMGRCVAAFARIEAEGGPRIVLSLEAEPRASAGDTREVASFLAAGRAVAVRAVSETADVGLTRAGGLVARHLGTCLDCCHSAVEFEDPEAAFALAGSEGPVGKIQFSSALAIEDPAHKPDARRLLLAMQEPVYLHQVTGRAGAVRLVCNDLPELAMGLLEEGPNWLECDEWRCHFHVPVDLERVGGDEGPATTREHADRILTRALAAPGDWTTPELHVEIETYTWDVLPDAARGPGDLVDGLEREYRHVMGLLEAAGWKHT